MFQMTQTILGITVLASLLIINCNDNSNPSSPPPTPTINKADLIGDWIPLKVIMAEKGKQPVELPVNSDSIIYRFTESDKFILYVKAVNCYSVDTIPYTINGNQVSAFDGSPTINISNNQIIATSSNSGNTYTAYFIRYSGTRMPPASWPATKCNDDTKVTPIDTGKTGLKQTDLVGTWIVTKSEESEAGMILSSEVVTDTSLLLRFTSSNIVVYQYDSESDDCVTLDSSAYSLDSNKIIGENYSNTETTNNSTETVSTTVEFKNTQLILSTTDSFVSKTSPSENYISGMKFYMSKFTGAVPPSNWPRTICSDFLSKTKLFKRK